MTMSKSRSKTTFTADSPSQSPVQDDENERVATDTLMMMGADEPVRTRSSAMSMITSHHEQGGRQKDDQEKENTNLGYAVKKKVLHFTPSWFSVTMGTGVIATLLGLLGQIWGTPQYSPGFQSFIRWPAFVFLLLDIAIFIVFSAAFTARYYMFPQVLPLTIKHSQKSMFLGTIPMGLITITSNICTLGSGVSGSTSFNLGMWPTFIAVGLWFFCVILSTVVAIGVPWSIFTYQKEHRFEATTAALLLPVVPPITAAATGSALTEHLMAQHPTFAFVIFVISYMQLGIGLPIALMILVLYLQRLILFKAPPREVIVSVFLPLGPCGQGGEAALHLGITALTLFPSISSTLTTGVPQLTLGVGQAMYGVGLITALMLFALGIWWAIIGIATSVRSWIMGHLTFNMGWWSFTFPLASLAICTARLAIELNSLTLKIIYTCFTLLNFALWVFVAIPTAKGFFSGDLLIAPCIADLPLDPLLKPNHNNTPSRLLPESQTSNSTQSPNSANSTKPEV